MLRFYMNGELEAEFRHMNWCLAAALRNMTEKLRNLLILKK